MSAGLRLRSFQCDDLVRVLNDAFEAMLGNDHGDTKIVNQPLERGEHFLGRPGIES